MRVEKPDPLFARALQQAIGCVEGEFRGPCSISSRPDGNNSFTSKPMKPLGEKPNLDRAKSNSGAPAEQLCGRDDETQIILWPPAEHYPPTW